MKFRRTILKQELAVKLFPDSQNTTSAMQLLRKEIRENQNLQKRLFPQNCNNRLHYYTHKQVEILLEHFSISKEEFDKL